MFLSCEICSYPWRFMVIVFYMCLMNMWSSSVKIKAAAFYKRTIVDKIYEFQTI